MNKIVKKEQFSEKVYCFEVEAPLIAKSCRPGNFVIVRVDKRSERVPYTIAKADVKKGTLTMVIQEVGLSSTKFCRLNVGDSVNDIVGPLGSPSKIQKYGTVVCAGGGIGIAAILPILTALKKAGNRVISVLAGRTKELVIMVDDVKAHSDEVIIMTDDGSYGQKGVVTVGVEQVIKREHVDKVLAIGPPMMMKFTSLLAKKYGIPNDVSLNTIMVDGTGMCGACRLTIGGKTKFVCIDGPEFDGDLVDWDEMMKRMGTFRNMEKIDMDNYNIMPKATASSITCPDKQENQTTETCSAGAKTSPTTTKCEDENKETAGENKGNRDEESLTDRNAQWRKDLRASMKGKERTSIQRVKMPELDPAYRATTRLEEVNRGLTPELAVMEARRCLDCPKPLAWKDARLTSTFPRLLRILNAANFWPQPRY